MGQLKVEHPIQAVAAAVPQTMMGIIFRIQEGVMVAQVLLSLDTPCPDDYSINQFQMVVK
jgi:hypothetical protein